MSLGELVAELKSGKPQRAERAALELPKWGNAALEKLNQLIQSADPDDRWWATRALAGFSQPAAGDLLAASLSDSDAGVRHCAALALRKRPHDPAIPELLDALKSDDQLFTRLAADALVAQGATAVEPLIAMLDSKSFNARVEAARALALIGDPRAVPALFKLLDSDSIVLQHRASEGLEKMGVGMSFFKPT